MENSLRVLLLLTHSPAITSAITKASCPPSKEGKGRELRTARLILKEAINPIKLNRIEQNRIEVIYCQVMRRYANVMRRGKEYYIHIKQI